MIGETFSHYKISEKLGEGGMGVVYKAEDMRLGRLVALKFLSHQLGDDETAKKRLLQEAKAASVINHPNVCIVYDIGESQGKEFISMEYVEGETLRKKFSGAPLSLNDALSLAVQIGEGLAAAHDRGIIHRDVKPDNIMVSSVGVVKVMDFGLAKLRDAFLRTRATGTVGTLAYMSPEQIQGGDVDARADIFGFGVVLYEMLTKRLPFRGAHEAAMMYSILHEEPDDIRKHLPDAPSGLVSLLQKSLEKEAANRYQSIHEMVVDIRKLTSQSPSSPRPLRFSLDRKVVRRAIARISALIVLAALFALVRWWSGSSQPSQQSSVPLTSTTQDSSKQPASITHIEPNTEKKGVSSNSIKSKIEEPHGDVRESNTDIPSGAVKPIGEVVVPSSQSSVAAGYRIAVLPFSNISPDAKDEYFADGMTEELISTLSRIQGLRVIARTSVMQYKGVQKSVAAIGRELNVKAVLEGSVRKSGNKLRITVQLIDAANQEHLWSEEYDRELTDVFVIQGAVAQRVAEALQVQLAAGERTQIGKSWTGNVEAYTLYLRGRYAWNKRSPADLLESVEYFKKSAQKDPRYALAYAGLADAYTLLGNYYVLPPTDAYTQAQAAAMKALEIDESLAEAHTSLAFALMHYRWDWAGAEIEFKRAIELNPSYAVGESWYAYFLTVTGRFDEAVAVRTRAQELDPLSVVVRSDVGLTMYFARKYEETVEQFHKTLSSDPSFYAAYIPLGAALLHLHRPDEAIAAFRKARVFSQNHPIPSAALAYALAVSGKKEEAIKIAEGLKKLSSRSYVSPYWIGIIYAGLGDDSAAFDWLDKGIASHDGSMIFLKVEPILDRLRPDPRFGKLLANVGLNN